ncbi:carbohydrate binding domain-containing protein [Cohnella lubricantis]|uniref:Carbohydrate binding domain-containing protein n=1 Tax=Cohnella lubricantis TaxID=2163172 RepID=A0A841TI05_9BACL|nr:carbohydrate binding domain-containing protein [Cohnella lubricantis]MBB6678868.1 carbohydrate binding domain-containing protein [Cohnella lubricantis]MBP2118229.1 beta-glucanase (GH16 family) [Cohnella lubricantis]
MSRLKIRFALGRAATALTLAFGLLSPAAASAESASNTAGIAPFKDVSSAHWAASALSRWQEAGILNGYPDGSMRPNQPITRSEFAALINRIFGFGSSPAEPLADAAAGTWKGDALAAAAQAGYLMPDDAGRIYPDRPFTRAETAAALDDLFRLPEAKDAGFGDIASLPDQAKAAISDLAAGSYLNGYPDGNFHPNAAITRAELAAVLDRLITGLVQGGEAELPRAVDGNVVVNRADATLSDTTIGGQLYLAAGIGDGDAHLNRVTVKGAAYVDGGGEHSITAADSSFDSVVINKDNDLVRFAMEGDTSVNRFVLQSGATVEQNGGGSSRPDVVLPVGHPATLSGSFGSVSSGEGDGEITELVIKGTVEMLTLTKPTRVTLEEGAVIGRLIAAENAGASTIDGPGTINQVQNLSASLKWNGNAVPVTPPAGEGSGSNGSGSGGSGGGNPGEDPWTLVWSDEFNDTTIDPSKWTYDIGNGSGGWGNNELEYYTDRPENVKEENGNLVITARKESYEGFGYTSTRIKTKDLFSQKYGKFEIRAMLPTGKGYWPAIWMLPQDDAYGTWAASGEIDIMENKGSEPATVSGTIHYGQQWPNNMYSGESYPLPNGSTVEDYHTYSLEWEPGELRWYVDGVLYSTKNDWYSKSLNQPANNTYPAPFDQPFFLLMNVAIGGNFDGNPIDSTVFPQSMAVDYVRVYELTGRPYRDPVPPQLEKEPLPAGARQPLADGNYVYNGAFDQDDPAIPNWDEVPGTDYWRLFEGEGGDGSFGIEDLEGRKLARISIESAGWQPYSVQLLNDVSVAKGHYYKWSFDAKSTDSRTMSVRVTGGESRGFAAYSPSVTVNLTGELQHFETYFQMKDETDIAARTEFNMGLDSKTVWIGNVRLEEVDSIPMDEDGPKTPLNGDGNHVYNGTFDQGDASRMTYWHLVEGGGAQAAAHVSEADRRLSLEIKEAGSGDSSSVKLLQRGIQLLQDGDYSLSFDAGANAARNATVALMSQDGSITYDSASFELGNAATHLDFALHMADTDDNEAQLVFLFGGIVGTITLDNVKLLRTSVYYPPDTDYYPLANGSFQGGLSPWQSAIDSGGSVTAELQGQEAKITVFALGQNPWSNMFYQDGLKLVGGLTYALDFDARASLPRKIGFDVENASYTRYVDETLDVGTDTAHYSYEFTMSQTDTAALKFFFGVQDGTAGISVPHSVYLSNVDLKVKNAPVSRPPHLLADTTDNLAGSPIEIAFASDPEWLDAVTTVKLNGKALEAGQFTLADGLLTLDANLFPLNGSYTIAVEATGYGIATVRQDVLANDGNLLRNGSFASGTSDWTLWTNAGGSWAAGEGAAVLSIPSPGDTYWSTQFYQEGIPVQAGHSYRLSFKGSSTASRPIYLEMLDTSRQVTYIRLTETADDYAVDFKANANGLKINFCIGSVVDGTATTPAGAHTLQLDDLRLVEIEPIPDPIPDPDPEPAGHPLQNGTFDSGTAGWTLYINDGSDASISSEDGQLKVAFTNYDGWFVYSTQVYQDHLQLDAGITYTLSFTAKATDSKDLIVSVENAGKSDIQYLAATTIPLTAEYATYSYDFTMGSASDPNGKLVFQLGSNNAEGPHYQNQSVYIDEVTLAEKI